MSSQFEGLNYLIQYRRRDFGHGWVNMAAFDVEGPATKYLSDQDGSDQCHWLYRMVEIATGKITDRTDQQSKD